MKWIKANDGLLIRLGGINFIEPCDNSIYVCIGQHEKKICEYSCRVQVEDALRELEEFISCTDEENVIFEFPEPDENYWMKGHGIETIVKNPRHITIMQRHGINTIYDFMPRNGKEINVRGIGEGYLKEYREARDQYIERVRGMYKMFCAPLGEYEG